VELPELAELVRAPAVRQFDADRPVPADTAPRLVELARWTGSARNRQPWRFVEVRDRCTILRLAELGAYAQFVADAPIVIAIASADDSFADTSYDTGRITQALVLGAAVLGLGCCLATVFPDANVETARTLLALPVGWCPRHLLALGYPAPGVSVPGVSGIPRGRLAAADLLSTIS
jgi:nitroreductase